ncbi:DAK2 domain-containing protein [Corynebacterium pelargi]|uniref:DAK2 domain protein n=1 Tax=Corynebacterium pelargi TaxID=1471400 RepID=A0A410W979_9CORY|nr:DAK2 domain-containing protein [Corynebacterium pelargi]QAU52508.1 DAK2 domain protein [Corynebacterium pelargi]GGG76899.1 kinase [Corynebacterium pelargi]
MATIERIDAPLLWSWAQQASAALSKQAQRINQLNVFPVADADTGSNMAHTLAAAVRAVEHPEDLSKLSAELASGAIRGARGNSGVVLSQIFRAIAQVANARGYIDAEGMHEAAELGLNFVHQALHEPVEGTIVSVLRAIAEQPPQPTLRATFEQMLHSAQSALEHTTSQLAVLEQAGVVDAGAAGLVLVFEVFGDVLNGTALEQPPHETHADAAQLGTTEVMFYIQNADLDQCEQALSHLGDSIVFGRESDTSALVHIHSTTPDAVLNCALQHGTISDIRLEALPATSLQLLALCPQSDQGQIAQMLENVGATPVPLPAQASVAEVVEKLGAYQGEAIVLSGAMLPLHLVAELDTQLQQRGLRCHWIHTTSVLRTLAASSVFDAEAAAATSVLQLQEAIVGMRVATIEGTPSHCRLCIGDYELSKHDNVNDAIHAALAVLLPGGGEQVSVIAQAPIEIGSVEGVESMILQAEELQVLAEVGVE